jgi:lipoprotein-anchoring transpeptidase ErfK/SrfK
MNGIELGSVPVSTGLLRTPTPRGEFSILRKVPVKHYIGEDFNLPNTKWNLEFKRSYYLHGAYWHNQFGIRPMSHGCVNIAYKDVEELYKFLDVGDKVKVYGTTPWGRVKKVEPIAKK